MPPLTRLGGRRKASRLPLENKGEGQSPARRDGGQDSPARSVSGVLGGRENRAESLGDGMVSSTISQVSVQNRDANPSASLRAGSGAQAAETENRREQANDL